MAKKRPFSCRTNAANLERATWTHLARSGSHSERRTRFILPARGFSHAMLQCWLLLRRDLGLFFTFPTQYKQPKDLLMLS